MKQQYFHIFPHELTVIYFSYYCCNYSVFKAELICRLINVSRVPEMNGIHPLASESFNESVKYNVSKKTLIQEIGIILSSWNVADFMILGFHLTCSDFLTTMISISRETTINKKNSFQKNNSIKLCRK